MTGELQAPGAGIHLTVNNSRTTNTINVGTDDHELAQLVSEATRGFDTGEIERLKALATGTETGTGPQTMQFARQVKTLTV
jgi:hypothetical protein